jgi:nitrile hydratase accessory protein
VNQQLTLAEVAAACAADGCGLPMPLQTSGGGHFSEPWQAHAFAMVLLLHERGVFSWPQWAETLARHIRSAQVEGDPDDGSNYYRHWLDALEDITIAQGVATAAEACAALRGARHCCIRSFHSWRAATRLRSLTWP